MDKYVETYQVTGDAVSTVSLPENLDVSAKAVAGEVFSWHPTNAELGDEFFMQDFLVDTFGLPESA